MLKKFISCRALSICAYVIIGICGLVSSAYASDHDKPVLKLYVFDCGMLSIPSVDMFGISNNETEVRELIVPCYIVEHEQGRLLWDGGLPSSIADHEGYGKSGQRLDKTFAEQIKPMGLDMGSFDYIAFSHMHYDHVGIANEVNGATLLIQKPEYEAAFADKITLDFFQPELYSNLKSEKMQVIEGNHDVFGDGSVQLLSAYGHTPGHQVLFLDLPKYGPLVLSGDLYHFRVSRRERKIPQFNYDAAMTLKAMDKIEQFVKDKNANFWIEHDYAGFKELKKAPEFYD
ncbi:MAG: N-acyl homoserine lactone hydrolase [Gammaproteobacteria bacterium]|jgi:N-acyl homoserine lactone hydrolase